MLGLLAIPAGCAVLVIAIWPALGAYLILLTSPLIVGVPRGMIPLRPNEMLLLLVMLSLSARLTLLMLSGMYRGPQFSRTDGAMLLLVATGSVIPVLLCALRGQPLSTDDLLYSFVLIKYYAVFRIFRATVLTVRQVTICLWISMTSAAIASGIAILQVRNLFGIPQFLLAHYDLPYDTPVLTVERGSSTLASAFGLGDLMIMNLIIALVLLRFARRRRWMLILAALLFLAGCLVTGEVSEYIGLTVAIIAFTSLYGSAVRRNLPLLFAAGALAALFFWPVIAHRIEGLNGEQGLPNSWEVRWDNLQRFFIPKISQGANWLLGVQPAPRVPAPERWREFVYIESGYLWLIWIGGLPFLVAFACFAYSAFGTLRRVARKRVDAVAAAAASSFCYLSALLVLTFLDPHLTLRGSADLFFPLLALSLVRPAGVARSATPQLRKFVSSSRQAVNFPLPGRGGAIAARD